MRRKFYYGRIDILLPMNVVAFETEYFLRFELVYLTEPLDVVASVSLIFKSASHGRSVELRIKRSIAEINIIRECSARATRKTTT